VEEDDPHHNEGEVVKKFAFGWAGTVLAFATAGCIAGVFLSGPVGSRIVSGILAVLLGCAAWRCWNIASGHHPPRPPRTPTPDQRPWEH
jgi:uncharacterized membrane protein YfcA